jgi:uncharacterized protein (TIGR02996 family)
MSATRAALEAALAADPDDLATHSAYADLLIEEGDPRGEYIRLQLAAEDRDQPADRLRAMEQQAFELRQKHETEWLGPLADASSRRMARTVGDMVAENVGVTFRRGWVHRIEVGRLTGEIVAAIATAPLARLLAELRIETNMRREPARRRGHTVPSYVSLDPLRDSPNVRNLRRLELGTEDAWQFASFDHDVAELVKRTPRLEHLRIVADRFIPAHVFGAKLPRLQTLHVTTNNNRLPVAILGRNDSLTNLARLHLDLVAFAPFGELEESRDPVYPDELHTLFRSPYLAALRHLALRLPGFGDAGVDELIASGLIDRLHGLDLCRCGITDEGAQALAVCPAVQRLEYLHLDNNLLSPIGLDALAAVGVQVSPRQFFAEFWDPNAPPPGEDIPF